MPSVVLSYLPDKVPDRWTNRRLYATPFGEHNKKRKNEYRSLNLTVSNRHNMTYLRS